MLIQFPPKQSGDDRAAAQPEDVTQGDHQRKDRRAERYAGDQVGVPRSGDEPGVHHIVDKGNDHAEHYRKRQFEVCFVYGDFFKEFVCHGMWVSFFIKLYRCNSSAFGFPATYRFLF